jgi:hypothetical protein
MPTSAFLRAITCLGLLGKELKMSVPDGLSVVDAILKAPIWDMGRLMDAAAERASQELPQKAGEPKGVAFGIDNPCKTGYGSTQQAASQEVIAWFLGILFAEYTAGILELKVTEGHCKVHRIAPDFNKCPKMQKEHFRMLEAFRDRVKQLLTDVDGAVSRAKKHLPDPSNPSSP